MNVGYLRQCVDVGVQFADDDRAAAVFNTVYNDSRVVDSRVSACMETCSRQSSCSSCAHFGQFLVNVVKTEFHGLCQISLYLCS